MGALNELIDDLISVRDALYEKINDQSAPLPVRQAALTEHEEVAHRLRLLMAESLKKEAAGLELKLVKIRRARKQLEQALAAADQAAKIFKGVAKYLTVVDQLLDQAKKLAAT